MADRLGIAAALGLAAVLLAPVARGAEPPLPAPRGWVTDGAGVVPPGVRDRITALVDELRAKTGAEIAVVTVDTTAPLDDFTYAMRIADAWKPGRKGEDTGIVFLVATRDRKVRILVGYGLEGILPDGLVGEIEDRDIVPAFRAGRLDEGIWRGVAALAGHVARARGVELTGVPPSTTEEPEFPPVPGWLLVLVLLFFAFMLYQLTRPSRFRRGGFYPYGFGGFGGGFGGGGGGFGGYGGGGGFGGGSFGGGGAGRSW